LSPVKSEEESEKQEGKQDTMSEDNDVVPIQTGKTYQTKSEEGTGEEDEDEEEDDQVEDKEAEEQDSDNEILNKEVEGGKKHETIEIQSDGTQHEDDDTDDEVESDNVSSGNGSVPEISSPSVPAPSSDLEERKLQTPPLRPSKGATRHGRRSMTQGRISTKPPNSLDVPSVSNRHNEDQGAPTSSRSRGGRDRAGTRRRNGGRQ
jgi:hypothetical protein